VASGRSGDAQLRFTFYDVELVPFAEADGARKAQILERGGGFLGGDDRRVLGQFFLHQLVEMVLVHVRQHHQVDRRQLVELDGGIGQALGGDAIAQVHVVALVQEVRVGEDGEALVADQDRGGADELDGAGRIRRRAAAGLQLEREHLAARRVGGGLLGLRGEGDRERQRGEPGGGVSWQTAKRHASPCHSTVSSSASTLA
jgi:hypothetical protein